MEAGAVQCGFCTPGLIVAAHDLLRPHAGPDRRRDPRGAGRQPVPLHGLREDPRRGAAGGAERRATRLVLEGCAVATVDDAGTEHADGHMVVRGRLHRRRRRRPGAARPTGAEGRIDGRGCLATPGLVNCHHHLYQWATRGLAQEATLFEWLQELYPVWAHVDAEIERAAARAGLAALARSGCTTASDHHYVFPRGAGDLLGVEIEAAGELGLRFHPCRGSMDLGRSRRRPAAGRGRRGPRRDPGRLARRRSTATTTPRPTRWCGSRSRPARRSRHGELMRESAELARAARRAAAHAHGRDEDEERFCLERFGCARSSTSSGSAGSATTSGSRTACTSTSARSRGSARPGRASRTARARTRGSARGSRRCAALVGAGAPVGLGRRRRRLQRGRRARRRAAPGAAAWRGCAAARAR